MEEWLINILYMDGHIYNAERERVQHGIREVAIDTGNRHKASERFTSGAMHVCEPKAPNFKVIEHVEVE